MTVSREEFGKLKPVTKEDDERLIKEGKKEARKGYAAKHYLKSKEKIQAQNRQRYGDNRENILKQQKIYTAEHREEHIKYLEEHKEEIVECGQKYREEHKEEIKLKHAAYLRTEAGKVVMNRFHCKRKRNLGFLELNEHFEGSEAHHINEGSEAGQTVFHLHIHLIPRYKGDVPDPIGGVRNIIPGKGNYPKNP